MKSAQETARRSSPIGFRYDETGALFTSQVVVNTVDDTVLLECSSGFLQAEGEEKPVLPIQSRLAMSPMTAYELGKLLLEVAGEMGCDNDGEVKNRKRSESWLRSAAALKSRMRAAINLLPKFER